MIIFYAFSILPQDDVTWYLFLLLISGYIQTPGYNPESQMAYPKITYPSVTIQPPDSQDVMLSFLHMDIGYDSRMGKEGAGGFILEMRGFLGDNHSPVCSFF